ncbi:TonB-dependent receptor [Dyella sp. SG609]|uniref:TonB-dependent receptor n=1 Tax=Dyella sp. SG609 TaxID=2587018 RepID=UPI0014453434|nr:TonB-dependent receptor [Dyella sp. SG609]NKJ20264.1 TonB-dependent receptor [Dyella sp. SG609]
MLKHTERPHGRRLSLLAMAILAALPGVNLAGETGAAPGTAPEQSKAKTLADVRVSGELAPIGIAIAAKQTQDRVMDAATSEQIQALPSLNIPQAVQRVAGVSASFNSDNVNGRDEAQQIAIRGLDASYNNISFDGAPMATTDRVSRGVRTDLLPASLVQEVDVYKTWQPDQDPNAVGGSINIVTRSAFDHQGRTYASVTAALGHATGTGKALSANQGLGRKGDAVFSATFGPDHRLGLVLAANVENRNLYSLGRMTSDNIFYNYYGANGANANNPATGGPAFGNGIPVPQQFKYWRFPENLQRKGLDGKLEAQFAPDLYGFLSFGANAEAVHSSRNEVFLDDSRSTGPNPVLGQTASTGAFARGEAEVGRMQGTLKREDRFAQSGFDWHIGEDKLLSARASYSSASDRNPVALSKYAYGAFKYNGAGGVAITGTPGLAMSYDTSGFLPGVSLANPAGFADLNNFNAVYWRHDTISIDDSVGDLKLDFRQNLDGDARGFGYAAGVDARRLQHRYNEFYQQFVATSPGDTLAGAGSIGGTLPGSNLPFLQIDPRQSWAQLAASTHAAAYASNAANSLQGNYSHAEDTAAAYLMGSYKTERLSVLAGLRQDDTWLSTTGNVRQIVGGATQWQPQTLRSQYRFTLPAASLVFNATDAVRLKLAASKTIGRPTYDAYAPNTTYSQNTDGSIGVTRGNPAIKPRQSLNLDSSAEWFLPHDSLLSAALFHKRISDEIYTLNSVGSVFFGGADRIAAIAQPMNASRSQLNGAELNFANGSLEWLAPWLAGAGYSGNATFLRGRLDAVTSSGATRVIDGLVNQPGQIRNFSVFYHRGGTGVDLGYHWTSRSLRLVDSALPSQDVYWKARKEIDLRLYRNVGSDVQTFFEIANLTRSPVTSVTGRAHDLLKDSFSIGRTYWVGVKYTPHSL